MTAIEGVAEVPATVTLPGETLFDIVARLLAALETCLDETERCETDASMMLQNAILDLYHAGFGDLFRECEGSEASDCHCPACNDPTEEAYMPLWLLAEKRGKEKQEEWFSHKAAIDSAA